jgi:uncharacterized protein
VNREQALELLFEYVKNPNMIKHSLATEAVMKALADKLGENEEKWAMAGLLHDLDVEITNADPQKHALITVNILKEFDLDEDILDAIERHNEEATDKVRNSIFHHALAAGETITGMITATTLVYPDKKLSSVKTKSITKRMKQKAFAASVNREIIKECEKINIPLNEFAELSLNAMRTISEELGL